MDVNKNSNITSNSKYLSDEMYEVSTARQRTLAVLENVSQLSRGPNLITLSTLSSSSDLPRLWLTTLETAG